MTKTTARKGAITVRRIDARHYEARRSGDLLYLDIHPSGYRDYEGRGDVIALRRAIERAIRRHI